METGGTPLHGWDTPVEYIKGYAVARDDLFSIAGIRGGKVRSCFAIATDGGKRKPAGLVTASARKSPQMQIVARLAHSLGIPARCHTARGEGTPEMEDARRHGAEIIQHTAGYNNVLCHRALADMDQHKPKGWVHIPFGMEHTTAVNQTRGQVPAVIDKLRRDKYPLKRILICCGSGISTCGVLYGLLDCGDMRTKVAAIQIGADPSKRISRYAPPMYRTRLRVLLSRYSYTAEADPNALPGIRLDPHYEAKCAEYLQPGDLFWVIGIRAEHTP